MKLQWKKEGLIYCPSGEGFFKTHAARPITCLVSENVLRIFFSSRDFDDRMLPTFMDVELSNPLNVLSLCDFPLIELGEPGTFDDSGITLASMVEYGDNIFMYYTGWKRRRVVSFELSIGMLIWNKRREEFNRFSLGPILAQDRNHPLLVAGPYVLKEENCFKMWYCSGTKWCFPDNNPEPIYTVFYAESDDGVSWKPHSEPVINYEYDGEVISAPWVLKAEGVYHMWYSKRGYQTRAEKSYTIGYAISQDGIKWDRRDEAVGISRSESGWDSEMICYPAFFPYQDKMYMFYSGNGVGRGGIGYATTENFLRV